MPSDFVRYYIDDFEDFEDWQFHGEGDCFFGVELELDSGGESSLNASRIISVVNGNDADHVIFKTDGSLSNGIEFISHPCTLEYHRNSFNWQGLLHQAVSMGYETDYTNNDDNSDYYGETYETAGMHVHISRSAFGYGESINNISKLALIIELFKEEVFKFSRRSRDKFNHYARPFGTANFDFIRSYVSNPDSKYRAVNTLHEHTVEIRVFKSTTDFDTLIGTLEFCQLLVMVANSHSVEEINEMTWNDLMNMGIRYGFNDMINIVNRYVSPVQVA